MTSSARFSKTDIDFSQLSSLSPDRLNLVFDHIKTLNGERDDEEPVSYASWVFEHGWFRYPSNLYKIPHQIYTAWLTGTSTLVDIAGLVTDDRGVGKDEGLAEEDPYYFGFFGGHNVHPNYRGRGIGTLMIRHRIAELQKHVNKTGTPAALYTFFINEISGRNLERAGFENRGKRFINWSKKEEWLFRLEVSPTI